MQPWFRRVPRVGVKKVGQGCGVDFVLSISGHRLGHVVATQLAEVVGLDSGSED